METSFNAENVGLSNWYSLNFYNSNIMVIPPIHEPQNYAGLYLYDFGTHVSVGYTANEIRTLRNSKQYHKGTAYEMYRVSDEGNVELRAVSDDRLGAVDALAFLRKEPADAKKDYDSLVQAALNNPAPCAVELILAKIYSFDPPDVTAVIFSASATTALSAWLENHGPDLGDQVVGGQEAYSKIVGDQNLRFASCQLRTKINHIERSPEEILATIDQPLQR